MDSNKSEQERLFHQSRELCIDNIEDELRLVGAKALDMSQYNILGDEIYNLDYISKIDMSTPNGVGNSEFMKRYYENQRQTGKVRAYTDIGYMYLHEASEHYLTSTEPFMLIDEYCVLVADTVKTRYGIDMIEETRKYRRSLPVQNKFIYPYDGGYLLLINGKLYPVTFILNSIIDHTDGLFVNIYNFTVALNAIQNLKQLRKKIKIKRIKKR